MLLPCELQHPIPLGGWPAPLCGVFSSAQQRRQYASLVLAAIAWRLWGARPWGSHRQAQWRIGQTKKKV